ncbi:MAG: hypothetical protein ABSE75_13465 [Acidimicrobiales bacterium]|jgi:hypothetical protein
MTEIPLSGAFIQRVTVLVVILNLCFVMVGPASAGTNIKSEDSALIKIVFAADKSSGVTEKSATISIDNAKSPSPWAMYTVTPKNKSEASDNTFSSFAKFSKGKWTLVTGTGPLEEGCPKIMPNTTCQQLETSGSPSPSEVFRENVISTREVIEGNLQTKVVVSPIQWDGDTASFTATGTAASPITLTFNFGSEKTFISSQVKMDEVFASVSGNSVPFLEVAPNLVVNICAPRTMANMGKGLATEEIPFLHEIEMFFLGSQIETANPDGVPDTMVSSNNVYACG